MTESVWSGGWMDCVLSLCGQVDGWIVTESVWSGGWMDCVLSLCGQVDGWIVY